MTEFFTGITYLGSACGVGLCGGVMAVVGQPWWLTAWLAGVAATLLWLGVQFLRDSAR